MVYVFSTHPTIPTFYERGITAYCGMFKPMALVAFSDAKTLLTSLMNCITRSSWRISSWPLSRKWYVLPSDPSRPKRRGFCLDGIMYTFARNRYTVIHGLLCSNVPGTATMLCYTLYSVGEIYRILKRRSLSILSSCTYTGFRYDQAWSMARSFSASLARRSDTPKSFSNARSLGVPAPASSS